MHQQRSVAAVIKMTIASELKTSERAIEMVLSESDYGIRGSGEHKDGYLQVWGFLGEDGHWKAQLLRPAEISAGMACWASWLGPAGPKRYKSARTVEVQKYYEKLIYCIVVRGTP